MFGRADIGVKLHGRDSWSGAFEVEELADMSTAGHASTIWPRIIECDGFWVPSPMQSRSVCPSQLTLWTFTLRRVRHSLTRPCHRFCMGYIKRRVLGPDTRDPPGATSNERVEAYILLSQASVAQDSTSSSFRTHPWRRKYLRRQTGSFQPEMLVCPTPKQKQLQVR